PINNTQIPLGNFEHVANTPFDFRKPHTIGERIKSDHPQLKNGLGYDHTFVLKKNEEPGLTFAARAYDPHSGRVLELFTSEPGVQFYSGNFLDGSLTGKGKRYMHRSGFCLEPQHFPDSPNQPQFPSAILHPNEEYKSEMMYKFSVKK
ncbi:MAG: galactose-1-epimerase, partial [Chitinophagaceae bacterium]